ncbi:MAG: YIP1 family protein [Clostridia bacterium]|nr:YIP1 family protein [Clostridia bacterium]
MKKAFKILLVAMALVMLLTTVVSAKAPYTTYTYSASGFVLNSPDAYVPDVVVNARYMGPDVQGVYQTITTPEDIAVGTDGKIYLSDSGQNCIFVLDKYYKYEFKINSFVNEQGVPDGFSGISGLYVNDKYIYACDTNNARIVIFDLKGNFVKTVNQPESALFNSDTIYRPIAVAVDSYGRLFIVSATSYEGIIVMSDAGDFYGYIGAQKVTISAWDAFWRTIRPESAADDEDTIVSTEYNNITIDSNNFIYVTTSSIEESAQQNAIAGKDKSGTYAPVKKLNASGTDVMARNGFYPPSGEVKVSTSATSKIQGASAIVDSAVGPEGSWSIIDQKRSKVFTYDANGNLLFAFGDSGNQIGSISEGSIKAVAYQGDNMILLDKNGASFTVYRRTEYGNILITALKNQNDRNYDAEVDDWSTILQRNNNFDVAYIGIASAMYRDGNYEDAMEYYKAAYDNGGYSDSYKEVRKVWMSKWFLVIPVVVVVALWLIATFLGYAGKKNKEVSLKVGQKNILEELLYAFHIMTHPFDGYWDLKHEKRGSVRSAYIILVVTILAFFYQTVGTGYIFAGETAAVDVFMTLASVAVPLLLWVISNWCLTTLFDGEGTLKDVFVASCYALIPLPLFIIPTTLVSNVLVTEEASMISLINGIAFLWMGVLLFFGMMITHGYSIGKGAITTLGTIVGMVFIMFIAVLFSTLVTKVISFVYNIVDEIQYRM